MEILRFCSDSEQIKEKAQEELQTEMEGVGYTISTYGGDTKKRMGNGREDARIK